MYIIYTYDEETTRLVAFYQQAIREYETGLITELEESGYPTSAIRLMLNADKNRADLIHQYNKIGQLSFPIGIKVCMGSSDDPKKDDSDALNKPLDA